MNQPTLLKRGELATAIKQLASFATHRAEVIESKVGFGYRPSLAAPTTFAGLQREHRACQCSGLPLRVSSKHNDTAIMDAEVNIAFRFWHDCTHMQIGENFNRTGEILVGQEQLRQLEAGGHSAHSLSWRLLFAETIAQTECFHRIGRFPIDQRRFTIEYLERGLPTAIRREAVRGHGGGTVSIQSSSSMDSASIGNVIPFPASAQVDQLGGDAA